MKSLKIQRMIFLGSFLENHSEMFARTQLLHPNIFPIGVTDHSYFNSLFLKCLLFLSCGNGAKKVSNSEILLRWESTKHSFSERSLQLIQLSIIKPDMFSMELARASRTSGKVAASAFSALNQNFFMLAMNREFFLTESTFWTNFYFPSSSGPQPYSQKETQLWVEDWRGALLHRRVSRRASNLFWLWRACCWCSRLQLYDDLSWGAGCECCGVFDEWRKMVNQEIHIWNGR